MELFRQRPAEQRLEIQEYLKGKGINARKSAGAYLNWGSKEEAKALASLRFWSIGFSREAVRLMLQFPPWVDKEATKEIVAFVRKNPIDWSQPPGRSDRYPLNKEYGYVNVYENILLEREELLKLSFRESTKRLREKLDEFFARGSDYERIESYFRCLAFNEGIAESMERQPEE